MIASNAVDTKEKYLRKLSYRLDPANLSTVNTKSHLIQTFFKIIATFLSFQC